MKNLQLRHLALMGILGGLALTADLSAEDHCPDMGSVSEEMEGSHDQTDKMESQEEMSSCGGKHGCGGKK